MERVDSKQMEYAFSNMLIFEKNNPWSMENLFTKEETDIQATEKW